MKSLGIFACLLAVGCGGAQHDTDAAGIAPDAGVSDADAIDSSVPALDGAVATQADAGDAASPANVDYGLEKSLKDFAKCDGTTDDSLAVAAAFAAAKNDAFTLLVDCPAFVHVGDDIARTIFIDNGTTVVFTSAGKLIVDNVFHPAFMIASSSNINLVDWNLEYTGGLPVDEYTGSYENNGTVVTSADYAPPAGAFNGITYPKWLTANRGIVFDGVDGYWQGPTNLSAIFYISGSSANIKVTGMNAHVPTTAGGDKFIPMVFALAPSWKSNQTVTAQTPGTAAQYVDIPHDLTFANITFDGTYMGWCGTAHDVTWDHITSNRYGDLQDAQGNNVGGSNPFKWFAPPHLFYMNYDSAVDVALHNANYTITNVTDNGIRVGVARDKGGSDPGSGYANSLKLACDHCTVDNYKSARPDGFMDVYPTTGLTVSNVVASYDSQFLNNIYPGWRWPAPPFNNVTFTNVSLTDTATTTTFMPVGNISLATNVGIRLSNVSVTLKQWAGASSILPIVAGATNDIELDYTFTNTDELLRAVWKDSVSLNVEALPGTVKAGASTALTWSSKATAGCTASGAWTGSVGTSGTKSEAVAAASKYTLTCTGTNAADSATVTLPVGVQ